MPVQTRVFQTIPRLQFSCQRECPYWWWWANAATVCGICNGNFLDPRVVARIMRWHFMNLATRLDWRMSSRGLTAINIWKSSKKTSRKSSCEPTKVCLLIKIEHYAALDAFKRSFYHGTTHFPISSDGISRKWTTWTIWVFLTTTAPSCITARILTWRALPRWRTWPRTRLIKCLSVPPSTSPSTTSKWSIWCTNATQNARPNRAANRRVTWITNARADAQRKSLAKNDLAGITKAQKSAKN